MIADIILVGAGLANLLIAWRLADLRPSWRFRILEAGSELGGNHTWSFLGPDLDPKDLVWISRLAKPHGTGHEVRFPGFERRLTSTLYSISSRHLAQRCQKRFGDRVRLGVDVASLQPDSVTLADGTVLRASCVIDGRGWDQRSTVPIRYRRALGQEVRFAAPHGLDHALMIDAAVPQEPGFRFFSALPLDSTTLLLEENVYAGTRTIDAEESRAAIARYAQERFGPIEAIEREENAILPIPLGGRIEQVSPDAASGVPRVGLRAGLFHATTGSVLPFAAEVANIVATRPEVSSAAVLDRVVPLTRTVWHRQRFFRLLNRMLFFAAAPEERYRVLERFYRLDEDLVARFYGSRLGALDRLRIMGRPPVPLLKGWATLRDRIRPEEP